MRRLAIALLLTAIPAFAQQRIERIELAPGTRAPRDIVIAETRLTPGNSYTDDELLQALYRVRRLPFVLSASFRIENDVLVLVIEDARPLFYEFDAIAVSFGGSGGAAMRAMAGYRFFPGSRGVLEVGVGGTDDSGGNADLRSATVQYTAYDLFGTRAFATVSVAKELSNAGGRETDPTLSFMAGIPLTQTQTLRATYSRFGERFRVSFRDISSEGENQVSLARLKWELDRTDDPYFALRGYTITAGPEWQRQKSNFPFLTGFPSPRYESDPRTFTEAALTASAKKYFPRSARMAYWGKADHANSTSESKGARGNFSFNGRSDALTVGVARNTGTEFTRGRWELGAGYRLSETEGQGFSSTSHGLLMDAGYTFRHRWGFVRINVQYLSD